MNPRIHQGWGMLGMLLVSVSVTGSLWNLALPVNPHWRYGFLLCLCGGVALIFVALRTGRRKA